MSTSVLSLFMPYCLKKQPCGRYALLNRQYKPVGFVTDRFVRYEQFPVLADLRIDQKTAARLSWDNSASTDEIFLYNDGCNPNNSDEDMNAYLGKLKVLAKIRIVQPESDA